MNWQNIKVSEDNTHFLIDGKPVFDKHFIEVLKFHAPGFAPVIDQSGAYHINAEGNSLYHERYNRTFGFYCNRAAVMLNESWFHINENGARAYNNIYAWCGNYQEYYCTVRDTNKQYFHIDLNGERSYKADYVYAGDFKDGIACVKLTNGLFKHIDYKGKFINQMEFLDLGVFHKNFATAKDAQGWHHIKKDGKELYNQRYHAIEPFYNGMALVTNFDLGKEIIDENGNLILKL